MKVQEGEMNTPATENHPHKGTKKESNLSEEQGVLSMSELSLERFGKYSAGTYWQCRAKLSHLEVLQAGM